MKNLHTTAQQQPDESNQQRRLKSPNPAGDFLQTVSLYLGHSIHPQMMSSPSRPRVRFNSLNLSTIKNRKSWRSEWVQLSKIEIDTKISRQGRRKPPFLVPKRRKT